MWSEEDRYSIPPRPEHGDEYIDNVVAYRDVSTVTKGKTEEALTKYYRWIEGILVDSIPLLGISFRSSLCS